MIDILWRAVYFTIVNPCQLKQFSARNQLNAHVKIALFLPASKWLFELFFNRFLKASSERRNIRSITPSEVSSTLRKPSVTIELFGHAAAG